MPAPTSRLLVLKTPPGTATHKALRELRDADPNGLYDYNHIYLRSGLVSEPQVARSAGGRPTKPEPRAHLRVGLIDTGVDSTHPAFDESLVQLGLRRNATARCPRHRSRLAPGGAAVAEIYAADVYCGSPTGGSVDALATAFSWLVDERVAVMNVSLVGPEKRHARAHRPLAHRARVPHRRGRGQ